MLKIFEIDNKGHIYKVGILLLIISTIFYLFLGVTDLSKKLEEVLVGIIIFAWGFGGSRLVFGINARASISKKYFLRDLFLYVFAASTVYSFIIQMYNLLTGTANMFSFQLCFSIGVVFAIFQVKLKYPSQKIG